MSNNNIKSIRTPLSLASVVFCPACGGENPSDAVFCGNHLCHKAFGEFKTDLKFHKTPVIPSLNQEVST